MSKRAKNLGDSDITQIVEMLDGWSGKLSWELLISAIQKRRYMRYTRQALHKHERIATAYKLRKAAISCSLSTEATKYKTPQLQIAEQRLSRITAENERLKIENDLLLEQFVRWAYNASVRGLDKIFLNQPLPGLNRELSRPRVSNTAVAKNKKGNLRNA